VGIVFASDGSGGLFVKGFVPRSTAAKSGLIQEFDLLVRVDGTDVHRWPVSEIAPLMLGPAGSNVTLGFLRRISAANEPGQVIDDLSLNGSMKSKVPKLWKQGDTPRNEAARS
jgi:C-terminal processing protease CtpA/Prc